MADLLFLRICNGLKKPYALNAAPFRIRSLVGVRSRIRLVTEKIPPKRLVVVSACNAAFSYRTGKGKDSHWTPSAPCIWKSLIPHLLRLLEEIETTNSGLYVGSSLGNQARYSKCFNDGIWPRPFPSLSKSPHYPGPSLLLLLPQTTGLRQSSQEVLFLTSGTNPDSSTTHHLRQA
jgi:hypothetical protein